MSVLKLKPSCKDYLWGGHRLVEEYGKEYDGEILAETWELSCHPDGPSTIVNGAYAGKTLEEYIEAEGKEVLGTNCRRFRDFPIPQFLFHYMGLFCKLQFLNVNSRLFKKFHAWSAEFVSSSDPHSSLSHQRYLPH